MLISELFNKNCVIIRINPVLNILIDELAVGIISGTSERIVTLLPEELLHMSDSLCKESSKTQRQNTSLFILTLFLDAGSLKEA